jgi:Ni,Fe-hydrogenase I large subunit
MNTENMMKLAHYLELVEIDNFNMQHWYGIKDSTEDDYFTQCLDFKDFIHQRQHFCNTTACIAGYASLLAYEEASDEMKEEINKRLIKMVEAQKFAEEWLDLDPEQSYRLFFADKNTVWSEYADDFSIKLDYQGSVMEWSDIHPKDAAEMLRRILSGKVVL